jgi:hypothetical protein
MAERSERGLKDRLRERPHGVHPFPPLVLVELLDVVEIVLYPDGIVKAAPQVHNHPLLARNAVEQVGKTRHLRDIPGHLKHK